MNGNEEDRGRVGDRKICPEGPTKDRGRCGETTACVFEMICDGAAKTAALLNGKLRTCVVDAAGMGVSSEPAISVVVVVVGVC